MKVSEITTSTLTEYIRIDSPTESDMTLLGAVLIAAKDYVRNITGLPLTAKADAEGNTSDNIDAHEDITIAVLVLCQDMWDNRSMYVEKDNVNKVVSTILGMHCRNLIA